MADLTPEGIKRLVERGRGACDGHPNAQIPWPHRILHELCDVILALQAELNTAKDNTAFNLRAQHCTALEARLREIAEIASNTDKRGWNDFDRIATIARSQGGEG